MWNRIDIKLQHIKFINYLMLKTNCIYIILYSFLDDYLFWIKILEKLSLSVDDLDGYIETNNLVITFLNKYKNINQNNMYIHKYFYIIYRNWLIEYIKKQNNVSYNKLQNSLSQLIYYLFQSIQDPLSLYKTLINYENNPYSYTSINSFSILQLCEMSRSNSSILCNVLFMFTIIYENELIKDSIIAILKVLSYSMNYENDYSKLYQHYFDSILYNYLIFYLEKPQAGIDHFPYELVGADNLLYFISGAKNVIIPIVLLMDNSVRDSIMNYICNILSISLSNIIISSISSIYGYISPLLYSSDGNDVNKANEVMKYVENNAPKSINSVYSNISNFYMFLYDTSLIINCNYYDNISIESYDKVIEELMKENQVRSLFVYFNRN